jgi:hypothetical protein
MSTSNVSRRQFLETSAAAAAVSVPYFGWGSPLIAQDAKTASKNDRPLLGCIGTGDRWNAVGPQAMNFADCVAVCDVDAQHAEKGKAKALELNAKKGRERTVEVHETIARCSTARTSRWSRSTTDHWYWKIMIEAMKVADVYCEKPLTLTIDEGSRFSKRKRDRPRVSGRHAQRSEMNACVNKNREQRIEQQFPACRWPGSAGRRDQERTGLYRRRTLQRRDSEGPGAQQSQLGHVAGTGAHDRLSAGQLWQQPQLSRIADALRIPLVV